MYSVMLSARGFECTIFQTDTITEEKIKCIFLKFINNEFINKSKENFCEITLNERSRRYYEGFIWGVDFTTKVEIFIREHKIVDNPLEHFLTHHNKAIRDFAKK